MDLDRRVELIKLDSTALAAAAHEDLTARIASCPDWSMADLVRHLFQVHRSWSRIVAEGLTEPDWVDAPFPADDELVDAFLANARQFAEVLGATDPAQSCWTWGPEHNAGFVQRFQVQEAALHRWDAEQAVGEPGPIAADGAADAVALFGELFPGAAPRAPAAFHVVATDAAVDVTMRAGAQAPTAGTVRGTSSDLLLVLWSRLPLDAVETAGDAAAIAASIAALDLD